MRLLLLLLLLAGFSAIAQNSRTSLSGLIKDGYGRMVSGASVTLTHLPTRTVYGCASNLSGGYLIADVKPGGPYLLEVTYMGMLPYRMDNLFLRLDEDMVQHITLGEFIQLLTDVKVNATKNNILKGKQIDAGFLSFNAADIASLPTVKRSISDYTRLSPYALGAAIAGGNYRQNFITIDGSEFNNNFGVGDNLPGNGAQPISLEAVAEISLNPAPYSAIWESGFIGSAMNIATRSGTNIHQGALYTYLRNGDSYGYHAGELKLDNRQLQYRLSGFRLGGPIIRNRLFYFASFEQEEEVYQPQAFQASSTLKPYGSASNIARPESAMLNEISTYLFTLYGYQTGAYQDYDFKNSSRKFLIRTDWNIAENNTLTIRYNQLNSTRPEMLNGSRSPLTPFAASAGRRSINALSFANSNFNTQSRFFSLAVEWDYKISNSISNMLRTSYTGQNEERLSDSSPFPFVDILKDGIPFTSFGYEPYSYENKRNVLLSSVTDILHWKPGKNSWDAGFQLDYMKTRNSYMPFGTGYYTFNSWEDFVEGKKPQDYAITYSTNADQSAPVYEFDYLNLSGFVQHNVNLGTKGKISFGLRGDVTAYPKILPENQVLSSLSFSAGRKVQTSRLPKSDMLISPRISFSYALLEEDALKIRGGAGIFTGRIPFVWIMSQARYSGVGQLSQTWQGQANTPYTFSPDMNTRPGTIQKGMVPSVSSVLSENFKMPQTWKSSLGLETLLPGNVHGSIDVLYNKDLRGIAFRDINLTQPEAMNIDGYPDHRLLYPQKNQAKFINPLNSNGHPDKNGTSAMNMVMISNSSGGYYFSTLLTLSRKFLKAGDISFSYIRAKARNYNDGDGDQTLSALNATPTVNGINNAALSYASYVVPDRVVASVKYPLKINRRLDLTLAVVYQGNTEGRFSYTYSKDLIGDGTNRSLIYIPANPSEITFEPLKLLLNGHEVTYTAAEQQEAFFNYINQDPYLSKRKGQYAERNGALLPWRHQFDFHLSAGFFIDAKHKKNRFECSVDVMNAGNLINRNWGLRKLPNSSAILIPVNLDKVVANGNVQPKFNLANVGGKLVAESLRNDYSFNSTFVVQLGLKYIFDL